MIKFDDEFIKTHTVKESTEKFNCAYQTVYRYCKRKKIKFKKIPIISYAKYETELSSLAGTDTDEAVANMVGCKKRDVFSVPL